jgi:hypothetical protein
MNNSEQALFKSIASLIMQVMPMLTPVYSCLLNVWDSR